MPTRRRILKSTLLIAVIVAAIGILVRRSQPEPISAELSDRKIRVTLLATGLGSISYSSDSPARAFVRKWLPFGLSNKLGPVTSASTSGHVDSNGGRRLVLLFQTTRLDGVPISAMESFLVRTDISESTGFTFVNPNYGSYGYGNGMIAFDVSQFPRRDRELHLRLYRRQPGEPSVDNSAGELLLEFSIPNPAYKPDYPVWTPAPLPTSRTIDPVTVTVSKLTAHVEPRYVSADVTTTASDPLWEKHFHYVSFEDATGNTGNYLSPFETAWKLHVVVRRTSEAKFTPAETWTLDPTPNPAADTFQKLDLQHSISGLRFTVRYLASAGKVHEEGGVITIQPPRSPGSSGMSTSSGSSFVNGKNVSYFEVENGLPFFLLQQPQLPSETELLTFVRDQDGRLLNQPGSYSTHGVGGVQYRAVTFTPAPETKTVQLSVILNPSRRFEFLVPPPEELKAEVLARKSATMKD